MCLHWNYSKPDIDRHQNRKHGKISFRRSHCLFPHSACWLSYLTRYIALPSSDLVASALKLNKEELILSEPTNHILHCLALHRALTLLLLPLWHWLCSVFKKSLFQMCCFHMGIFRKGGGCKGLPGWFGALFSMFARLTEGGPVGGSKAIWAMASNIFAKWQERSIFHK